MHTDGIIVAAPSRAILRPLLWVLGSGWLPAAVEVLETPDDRAASRALADGRAGLALVDPAHWAWERAALRPVLRSCVALGPAASDLLLLSEVRPDGLERVTAPPALAGTSEEAVAGRLVREYLGVQAPLELAEAGAVGGPEGRIVGPPESLGPQPHEYVEGLSRQWWLLHGAPWVRALPVEAQDAPPDSGAERLLKDAARLLEAEAETAARELARAHGGDEARWLELVRALSFGYGAEERKGLGALLDAAARRRLCPRVEDAALPRY
jgi:hypothetical protein